MTHTPSIRDLLNLIESAGQGGLGAVWAEVDASGTVTEGITAAEKSWAGGIADFGDKKAAYYITRMPGYAAYQAALTQAVQKHLGVPFHVYRVMPEAAFNDWFDGPHSVEWATSLSEQVARGFLNFAGHRKRGNGPMVLIRITVVEPGAVIMRGKFDEAELVINPYEGIVDEEHITVLERFA